MARKVNAYRKAAQRGDADAMCSLGDCYSSGLLGVAKDDSEAARWYRMSADAGNAGAATTLGVLYFRGIGVPQDYSLAAQWFKKAADAGHTRGSVWLGECYRDGKGIKPDFVEALRLFRKAADEGIAHAMYDLGVCYSKSKGVPHDLSVAAQWFRKAADGGSGAGMENLSMCYARGSGVPQDDSLAFEWCKRAADTGKEWPMVTLGERYYTGKGVTLDFGKAILWYKLAVEKFENHLAMSCLGTCYLEGNGVPKDTVTALEWYHKAVAKNCGAAMTALGRCYEDGTGVVKDWAEATEWYCKSYRAGSTIGTGVCYQHGLGGFPQDLSLARRCFEKVAAHGSVLGTTALPRLDATLFATRRAAVERGNPRGLGQLGEMYEHGQGVPRNLFEALACYSAATDAASAASAERVRAMIAADRLLHEQQLARRKRGVPDAIREDSQLPVTKTRRLAASWNAERREHADHAQAAAEIAASWTLTRVPLADCPVCLQRIGVGQSVLLTACLHALCRACTGHMLNRSTPFPCPICQVPAAPTDLRPHALVESAAADGGAVHECTDCRLQNDDAGMAAEFTCATCNIWLCDDHARRHRKAAAGIAAHAVAPSRDGNTAVRCPAHGLPYEAYCASEACQTLVCPQCLTTTHPTGAHATRVVDDAFVSAYRARLTVAAADARAASSELVQRAADAAVRLRELDARDATLLLEVNRSIDALVQILETRRTALIAELEAASRAERAVLQASREADEHQWRLADSAATIAEQVARSPASVLVDLEAAATRRSEAATDAASARYADPVPIAAALRLDLGATDSMLSQAGWFVPQQAKRTQLGEWVG